MEAVAARWSSKEEGSRNLLYVYRSMDRSSICMYYICIYVQRIYIYTQSVSGEVKNVARYCLYVASYGGGEE
jgi:hypothetical protein